MMVSLVDTAPLYATVLLDLFTRHRHEGRVILPLLKTIDLLLNRLCLESLMSQTTFITSLLQNLREEAKECTDTQRLTAILNVSCCLLASDSNRTEVLSFICEFLTHKFPRIRSLAAEKLYVRLLETHIIEYDNESHPAIEMLLNHSWELDDGSQKVHHRIATDILKTFGPEKDAAGLQLLETSNA